MKVPYVLALVTIGFGSFMSCSKEPSYLHDQPENNLSSTVEKNRALKKNSDVIVIKAAGDINTALAEFRDLLGNLNTKPGAVGGRREINWDAVPANLTNNNSFLGDFFGSANPADPDGRKRGLINTTPGTGFRISDTNFADLKSEYAKQFKFFSPKKTFIAVGSTITDNFFKVPGTNTDASVHGFGVVFSDVNNESSTSMEFYDGERLLGVYKVPNNGNNAPGA